MRRRIAAGNWKMNGTGADLAEIEALAAAASAVGPGVEVLLCPPATLVERAARIAAGRIRIGGQDCHAAASGAHTGDISAAMLAEAGAGVVILGHSERRADHGETDACVAAKAAAALAAGIEPVICLGETAADRDAGRATAVTAAQLDASIPQGADPARIIIAYEPVWAIGSGTTASAEEIETIHAGLRARLLERFGAAGADVPILYGGSVKPANAAQILAIPGVDGALVGAAALRAADFQAIIAAFRE